MSTFANSENPDEMQHIMLHFIGGLHCKGINRDLQTTEYTFFENYYLTPLLCTMEYLGAAAV